ncbi:MAG: ABC transporter substrate-binding protein [Chloroflexota bacterium]
MTDLLTLRTAIGSYPHTAAVKAGQIASDRVALQHVEVDPINRAFRRMIRDAEFELSEMAITTHAIAHSFDKPYVALPIVVFRGFPHASIACRDDGSIRGPKDLEGRKIGVRAYSQTTGAWVRGVLASDYGVELDRLGWVVQEGSHVAEYVDPPNVELTSPDRSLEALLEAREVDAIVAVNAAHVPGLQPVIPDPDAAAIAWFKRTGVYPINHLLVIRRDIAAANPWLAAEVTRIFMEAKNQTLRRLSRQGASTLAEKALVRQMATIGADPLPYDLNANRPAVEMLTRFAFEQRLTPRKCSVEELFDPASLTPAS